MTIEEKNLTVDGRNIHYFETGFVHGRPIILLHGGFGDARANWWETLENLGQEFHVVAPDLPGYGQSDPLPDMRIRKLVDWLAGFIEQKALGQVVLVGSSFGGLLARVFAAGRPNQVPAVVMVNGGVIPSIPALGQGLARVPGLGSFLFTRFASNSTAKKNIKDIFHQSEFYTDEFALNAWENRQGLARLMRGMTLSDFPADVRKPIVPVLLIWGEEDMISPLAAANIIKKNIPGAKMAEITDCGHLPHLEVAEVFATQVSLFLNNLDRKQRDLGGVGPLIGGM